MNLKNRPYNYWGGFCPISSNRPTLKNSFVFGLLLGMALAFDVSKLKGIEP